MPPLLSVDTVRVMKQMSQPLLQPGAFHFHVLVSAFVLGLPGDVTT